jgi:signal transduction histidine kinase
VVLAGYAVSALTGLGPPFAAWVLVWSTGSTPDNRSRSVRLSVGIAVTTAVLVVVAELLDPGAGASALLLFVTAVVLLSALLLRAERLRLVDATSRAATEERLRIARDLHDLVGHGLSVVAVQSSTARLALQHDDTTTALKALGAVERTSRTAMLEMRQMLDVLTDVKASTPDTVTLTLADVDELVRNLHEGGMQVSYETSGPLDNAPKSLQQCAYRVVQESLTNAAKHAPDAQAHVRVTVAGSELVVAVTTVQERPSEPTGEGGLGLDGLRARVVGAGGVMTAGPVDVGWRVEARLPLADGGVR